MSRVQGFTGSKVRGTGSEGQGSGEVQQQWPCWPHSLVMAAATLGAAAPWREAAKGYEFAFPRDHASHPDYKIEWWY